ncbi:MAG: hypothetical protein SH850_27885 [Planctomycetaceae bacterium]|nr:hypothetical protein [Planctomycetaceae bacterium]
MPTKVKCDECGTVFAMTAKSSGTPCPLCGTKKKRPADGKKLGGLTCPTCKKTLPRGMTFCVGCGMNVGTADAGDRFIAGERMEEQSQKDIVRTRFMASGWWSLFRIFR